MTKRLTYEESYRSMQQQEWFGDGDIPPLPEAPPRYDDEVLGISFFRTSVDGKLGADFQNMTLPRTFFGRSEVCDISFAGTDFTESVANWNDFTRVDFTGADLTLVDFRACVLTEVIFRDAKLAGADLRMCTFERCNFDSARVDGMKMTKAAGELVSLSKDQREVIEWHETDGDEPDGG